MAPSARREMPNPGDRNPGGSSDPLPSPSPPAKVGEVSDPDAAIELLAAAQHGVISRAQAIHAGLSGRAIRHRLESGRWRHLAPSVYGFPGNPDTWWRRVWIAHLHAGPESAVSHRSSGRMQQLGPIEGEPIDLIVPRHKAAIGTDGVRRFRLTDLRPEHVTTVDGLPVTTPARTIVDLASVLSPSRLRRIVEHSEVTRRCPLVAVAATLDDLRGSGKPGVRALCDVLDEMGPGEIPRSQLERYADEVIDLTRLPRPRHEYPLPTVALLKGFVDRCWPDVRLIVEADGRRWHTRRAQIALDHDRDLEAARCGYQTLRLTWERLRSDPEGTAVALRDIYDQRRALLSGAA